MPNEQREREVAARPQIIRTRNNELIIIEEIGPYPTSRREELRRPEYHDTDEPRTADITAATAEDPKHTPTPLHGPHGTIAYTSDGHPVSDSDQPAASEQPVCDPEMPGLTSTVVNDACWKFIEAMPHPLPGPIWNGLKPALYAALQHYHEVMLAAPSATKVAPPEGWRHALEEALAMMTSQSMTLERQADAVTGIRDLLAAPTAPQVAVPDLPDEVTAGGYGWLQIAAGEVPVDDAPTVLRAIAKHIVAAPIAPAGDEREIAARALEDAASLLEAYDQGMAARQVRSMASDHRARLRAGKEGKGHE